MSVGTEAHTETKSVEVKLKLANSDLALKSQIPGEVVIHTQGKRKIFPVTENVGQRTLALPFFNELTEPEINRIVETLKTVISHG